MGFILQKIPLQKKIAEIMTKCGLKNIDSDVERCLSLCVEKRLRGLIGRLVRVSKQRVDSEKSRHNIVVMSDVRAQILAINQKVTEEREKKQAEAEKLLKHNEPDSNVGVNVDKKDEGRGKVPKVNKEDDKMRITAANVAARAAVGGDNMLSKWQLMAQIRQKHDGRPEVASCSQSGKGGNNKSSETSAANVRDVCGTGKKGHSASPAPGMWRQFGNTQAAWPNPLSFIVFMRDFILMLLHLSLLLHLHVSSSSAWAGFIIHSHSCVTCFAGRSKVYNLWLLVLISVRLRCKEGTLIY